MSSFAISFTAARALDFDVKITICIDRGDLNVNNGLVGRLQNDFGIVLRVTAGKSQTQSGECHFGIPVEAQIIQCHTDGMRTGVVNAARKLLLQCLPSLFL